MLHSPLEVTVVTLVNLSDHKVTNLVKGGADMDMSAA